MTENLYYNVYVYDRQTGITERVSVDAGGSENNRNAGKLGLEISADGRYVTFQSHATNLTGDTFLDTSADPDVNSNIFVYDRVTQETVCVSKGSDGTPGNGASADPTISADGRYVGFSSWASNLVPGNQAWGVYVYDRWSARMALASVDDGEALPEASTASGHFLSADGRQITFTNQGTGYIRDQRWAVNKDIAYAASAFTISADGRKIAGLIDGALSVVDPRAQQVTTISLAEGQQLDGDIILAADGSHLIYSSLDGPNAEEESFYNVYEHGPLAITPPLIPPLPPYAAGASPGDTVNLATGELEGVSETDLSAYNPVGPGVAFSRTFSSYRAKTGYGSPGLSPGWVHNYDITVQGPIFPTAWGDLTLSFPNGATEALTPAENPTGKTSVRLNPPAGAPYLATGVPGATVGEWQSITLTWGDGSHMQFTPCAEKQASAYMLGVGTLYQLDRVTNTLGQYLTFEWDDQRVLQQVKNQANTILLTMQYGGASGLLS
ncbi:MAG TPA: hypothetical protein VGM23_12410, partial [Armatimonadota bacterium]